MYVFNTLTMFCEFLSSKPSTNICEKEEHSVFKDTKDENVNDTSLPSTSGSYVDSIEQKEISPDTRKPDTRKPNTGKRSINQINENDECPTSIKKSNEEQKKNYETINKVEEKDSNPQLILILKVWEEQ